ncbi:MAG TPA: aldehyde dehydrogenase family protein [Chthoniobacterales bacterium]
MNARPFLLNGEWIVSHETIVVRNPFDGSDLGMVSIANAEHIETAVAGCASAFQKTRRQSARERSELLQNVRFEIEKRAEEFVDLLVREAGKPVDLARIEVSRAQQTFGFAAAEALRQRGEPIAIDASAPGKGHTGFVHRVPLGVILGITPFNFPLNLVAHKIAPALATGNTILVKPSLRTPLICFLLGEALVEAGILSGQVNILTFHHDLLTPLFTDPRIKMTSFTGSAAVGWGIKAQAVKQRVCLELGGNAALIIHSDADWEKRLPSVAAACFGYAGQSCISVQRIFVQESIYETFKQSLVWFAQEKVKAGDPAQSGVLVGPMIDPSALEKVTSWIAAAQGAGAKCCMPPKVNGRCLHPVVLENVPSTSEIACEEAFAPIVVLEPYEEFEDAIVKVNASRYGLQAGVFTSDLELAEKAYQEIDAGAVLINQTPTFRVENMPYGGVKDSGFGREGVGYTMEEMTEMKTLIVNYL